MKNKIISYIKQVFMFFGVSAFLSVTLLELFHYKTFVLKEVTYWWLYDRLMIVLFLTSIVGVLCKNLILKSSNKGAVKWLKYALCVLIFICSFTGISQIFPPFTWFFNPENPYALYGRPEVYGSYPKVFGISVYLTIFVLIALFIVTKIKRKKDLEKINKKLAENFDENGK